MRKFDRAPASQVSAIPYDGRQRQQEMEERLKEKAEELGEELKQEWSPVAENLDRAMKAFDDLEGATPPACAGSVLHNDESGICKVQ